eukprot:10198826-Heterocapsa_arctica.AAC.1
MEGFKGIMREGALRPQPWSQEDCKAYSERTVPTYGLFGVYGQAFDAYQPPSNESQPDKIM